MGLHVIDGAPGSGKTTLLFGKGSEDKAGVTHYCFKDLGLCALEASSTKVMRDFRLRGLDVTKVEVLKDVFDHIVSEELKRGLISHGPAFLDRGLHGYESLALFHGISLPASYYDSLKLVSYENPIVVLKPVEAFDISGQRVGANPLRIFTLEERMKLHEKTVCSYRDAGYGVVEVDCVLEEEMGEASYVSRVNEVASLFA